MRPRIFIGSSKEGLNIAEQIKAYFFLKTLTAIYGVMTYSNIMTITLKP